MVKHCINAIIEDDYPSLVHSIVKATDIESSPSAVLRSIGHMLNKKTAFQDMTTLEKRLTSRLKKGP